MERESEQSRSENEFKKKKSNKGQAESDPGQPSSHTEFKMATESCDEDSENQESKVRKLLECFSASEIQKEEALGKRCGAEQCSSSQSFVGKPASDPDADKSHSCFSANLTAFSLATCPELHCIDRYNSTYEEELLKGRVRLLGKGGFGSVVAGHRRADHLPVAIKKTKKQKQISKVINNHIVNLPREVAVLVHLGAGPEVAAHNVTPVLLDWFNLDDQLIMIFQRPVPCMSLVKYLKHKNGTGQHTCDIKSLMRQLVDKALEMQSKNVFHRDIKLENILIIETNGELRARYIDFGCSDICSLQEMHSGFRGTDGYMPPEWVSDKCCAAGPTTVWQLGTVLYQIIHGHLPFENDAELVEKEAKLQRALPNDCKDFLKQCFIKRPRERPALETLRRHPWLN